MTSSRSVLLTHNLYDYALAISAHRRIAAERGLESCYPVLLSPQQLRVMEPLINYYGITTTEFASLFPGTDPVRRSEEIYSSLFGGTSERVLTSSSAAPGELAHALSVSLNGARPLVLVDAAISESEKIQDQTPSGRPGHLVVACSHSPLAVGAALYAQSTDKRFCLVDDLSEIESTLQPLELSSVMLVDNFPTFGKTFLEELLQWSLDSRPTPLQFGILTAYSPSEFSALVWRTLVHRDFHLGGHRSSEPQGVERISLKEMKALEYYIIREHGNEMHMRHGQHEVICGAFSSEFKQAAPQVFDCETNCPYEERMRSSELPAHNVIILSCNALTFGDGLVPPEYTVLLNFLNGWTTSAIAPFKHVQVNSGMVILVDSLIRSGFSLGQISQRLNSITKLGTRPDYAYVLVGDPEVVPGASDRYLHPNISVEKYDSGVLVKCSPEGKRVMECLIPQETIADLIGNGHGYRLTVDPISEELCKQDIFFAFMPLQKAQQLGVLVFSDQSLSAETLLFRLHPAHGISDAQKDRALEEVRRVARLSIFGIDEAILQKAKDNVLQPLRAMVAYPRPLELALGDAAARHFDVLLNDALWKARRLVIETLLAELAKSSLWLSHQYGQQYPLQYQLQPESPPTLCYTCGGNISNWRHEDNCTDLPSRTMVVCARCGIIADCPAPAELEIRLPAFKQLVGARHQQQIIINNRSNRKIELSFFVQFNQWQKVGSSVDPPIQDLVVEPGETVKRMAQFIFDGPLPSGIREIQCCALTDRFDLYCVTQRGISSQGGAFKKDE